jgi:arylsulfatase A-like enzyme
MGTSTIGPMRPTAIALLAASSLAAACSEPEEDHRGRYNVVIVSIDTLRADHLASYGYARDTAPNIRARIAEEGVVFERAYSQSPKTGPAHMTMLTGLLPDAHGVKNMADDAENRKLSPGIQTLATMLRNEGYRTGAFTAKGHVVEELGFDQGFDVFRGGGGVHGIFQNGMSFVEEVAGQRFFLFVHTYEVHDPYTPPRAYRELWADPDYAGAIISDSKELTEAAGKEWPRRHEVFWSKVDRESPADVQHLRDLYDGSIRLVDTWVGALLDTLEEHGELDRTLFVVLSDHGEEFLEHGEFLHETNYQELLHVPLIVRPPVGRDAGLRGERVASVVRLVDVVPTVLDVLDVDPGHDPMRIGTPALRLVGPAARGGGEPSVVSTWPRDGQFSYRKGDWKLIWLEAGEEREETFELYDLAADPAEQADLAAAEPDRVAELHAELGKILAGCRAYLASVEAGEEIELDAETRADLQAIGYIDVE